MVFDEVGEADLRGENISRAVKGFASKLFKLKQIALIQSSNKLDETYYREEPSILTASGNRNIKGVARGALPPEVHPSWEKKTSQNIKYMAQEHIFFEDRLLNAIDVQARTLFKVAEAIAESVDDNIYNTLTSDADTSGVVAASDDWNSVTEQNRDPIGDILKAIAVIGANHYDIRKNGFLLIREADYANMIQNSKIINNPSFKTADVVSNGVVAKIANLSIIISQSVDTDECMLVVGQRACTWKSVLNLTTDIIEDPKVSVKVRATEMGQLIITDPKGIYTITEINVSPA